MESLDGQVQANLEHATRSTDAAVRDGARLVLFPELMPQGYRLTQEIWDSAEPFDGPTKDWLISMARGHGIYIGTSFLEMRGSHFLNTFVLADPGGEIAGIVRKQSPSMWEAYFFRGERSAPWCDTDLGRIGIGICFDNHTHELASAIATSSIDLMLMPHSYCTPTAPGGPVSQADIDRLNMLPVRVAEMYNAWFGVPVVLCNKSGAWDSPVPNRILGQPQGFRFSGRSQIIDSDGTIRAALSAEEGVAVGSVTLDPVRKKVASIPKYSRYIYPGSVGREIIRLIEWQGRLAYTFSRTRKLKASRALQQARPAPAARSGGPA